MPMFYVMGVGFLLCLISRYIAKDISKFRNLPFRDTMPALLLFLLCVGLVLIGGFMLLTLVIIAFWYLFLTENVLITIPILFAIFLILAGAAYYNNSDNT